MFTSDWEFCKEHKVPHPTNALCPKCAASLHVRETEILSLNWKEVIPLERQLDFMKDEAVYCRDEEQAFWACDMKSRFRKEKLRMEVLEKRAEFLAWYVSIITAEELLDVHKSTDSH